VMVLAVLIILRLFHRRVELLDTTPSQRLPSAA